MHVGLVAGVPHDRVAWRLEHPVHGEGDLDHPEIRAEMTTGGRHRVDQELADLRRERGHLLGVEAPQVGGAVHSLQEHSPLLSRLQRIVVAARSDSRNEPIVANTAVGSYPQWAMQFAHRGSRPRPYRSQSVVSTSSR